MRSTKLETMNNSNKNKVRILLLFLLLVFIAGCSIVEYYQRGRALAESDQIPANSLVYALPRTSLSFDVTVKKTMFTHGPYYKYAEKYLGITDVSDEDWVEWTISDINIRGEEEIDPEQYYMIESDGPLEVNALALSKTGMILTPNPGIYTDKPVIQSNVSENPEPIFHTDLSVKRNIAMVYDTNYRFIETDTGFVQVPYLYEREVHLTLEEQAEEAANFIIKIRKRRFKLMSGQYDVFPEGIALQYAVENLTVLEKEYVALFIGKYMDEYHRLSYRYIPGENPLDHPHLLFRFSLQYGVVPVTDLTGKPVMLEITKQGTSKIIDNLTYTPAEEGEEDNKALFYRIPEVATIRVIDEQHVLAEKDLLIYQFGPTVRLPVNFMLK